MPWRRVPLAVYPAALLAVLAVQAVAPQANGPLALGQVFAPYLFLPLVALLPPAVLLRDPVLGVLLTACAVAFAGLAGPEYVSLRGTDPPAGARQVRVVSWNALRANDPARVVRSVRAAGADADVVAVIELSDRHAVALAADPVLRRRYPGRVLGGERDGSLGMLSRLPVLASGVRRNPALRYDLPTLWVRLDLGGGRTLTVVVAHPLPADIDLLGDTRLPVGYDARPRDSEIAFVRSVVDGFVAAGEPVLLVGDFNVTDREPAARTLTAGLSDAHRVVGRGPGSSWGPLLLRRRGLALLRIDRMLGGPGVLPRWIETDCTWRGSDHCLLRATFSVAPIMAKST